MLPLSKQLSKIKNFIRVNYLLIIVIGFLLVLLFLLNHKTPLISDDYVFVFKYNTTERITNPLDLIPSMKAFYLTWGGRIILIGLEQVFVILDKGIFNILNTILTVLLFYIIAKIAEVNLQKKPYYLIFIFALFWFFTPNFGQDFMWICGVATYLWGILFTLIYIYLFENDSVREKISSNKFYIVCLILFSFVAGNTMENLGVALLIFQAIYLFFIIKDKKQRYIFFSSFILTLVGYFVLIIAPGNYVRMSYLKDERDLITKYSTRTIAIFKDLFKYFSSLFISLIPITFLYILSNKNFLKLFTLVLAFSATFMSMIMSPIFPERAWLGSEAFLILILMFVCNKVEEKFIENNYYKYAMSGFVVFITIILLLSYRTVYKEYIVLKQENAQRETLIREFKKQNIEPKDISLRPFTEFNPKYSPIVGDITEDSNFWLNTSIATYYGLHKINGVK